MEPMEMGRSGLMLHFNATFSIISSFNSFYYHYVKVTAVSAKTMNTLKQVT